MSTHENIVKITSEIIAREGIEAVSTRYVCKVAKISAPTLYHYFPSKQALLIAVIDAAYAKYSERSYRFQQNGNIAKALIEIWNTYFEFLEKEPAFFRVILIAHLQQKIPKNGYQLFKTMRTIFKAGHKKGLLLESPEVAASIFYSSALGAALLLVSQNFSIEFKNLNKKSKKIALRGLLAPLTKHRSAI